MSLCHGMLEDDQVMLGRYHAPGCVARWQAKTRRWDEKRATERGGKLNWSVRRPFIHLGCFLVELLGNGTKLALRRYVPGAIGYSATVVGTASECFGVFSHIS